MIRYHLGDCVKWAKRAASFLPGYRFHALICDPPYHLTSIVDRFGKPGSAAAKPGRDGAFGRVSRGFMGEKWDGGDVAFKSDTWAAFLPLLHPGAFCAAFAGSRGWHRMAVAIEDAGFIIHPTIFGWVYGSGLPKGHRVDDPRFDGHRYGLQALKPAVEPIIIFQKPYEGRALTNILETGAGTLNIDGTRISTNGEAVTINRYNGLRPFGGGEGEYQTVKTQEGRYPSNFIVMDRAESLGEAARYFFQVEEQIDHADPVLYSKKASRSEKEAGLEGFPYVVVDGEIQNYKNPHPSVKPLSLTKYLATLLLPPAEYGTRRLFVPFSGVGSDCIGAAAAGWEEIHGVEITEKYIPYAEARSQYWDGRL